MNFKNNRKPFFKHIVASALLWAGFPVSAQAIDIVWTGTNQVEDQALISFIQGNFSDVNITYGNFSDYATNAAVIEGADLFILGRQLASADYANATNSASFNALNVPVVAFTSYVTRPLDGRWGWHDGDIVAGLSTVGAETTVTAAGATAFGVAAGAVDWLPEPDAFNAAGAGLVGDGDILATVGGNILAAHWNAGALSGTGATFGSERFLFNVSEVGAGGITTLPAAAGQQALINALVAYTPLTVATERWNINGGGSFNAPGNWSANAVPTQNPVFGSVLQAGSAPATITLDSSVSLNSVSFQNSNQYVLAGPGTLTLTGEHEIAVGAGSHQITANIAGTAGLVKTGTGTLVLNAAKGYTGATDVQAGTLQLNHLDAIDNQASGVLNISGAQAVVLLGAGATGALAAELTGSGQLTLGADLAPTDVVTINRSNSNFNGVVRIDDAALSVANSNALGAGGTTVTRTVVAGDLSTGKLALSSGVNVADEVLALEARQNAGLNNVHLTSAGANTWGGPIVGQTGGVQYNIESTSGTLTLGGTIQAPDANTRTFAFSGAGNTTITGRVTEDVINVDTAAVTQSANNNVGVLKRGGGTLTIATGTSNDPDFWFGPTVVEQGTLAVTDPLAADVGELRSLDVTIKSGGTLNVSAFGTYSQQIGQTFRGTGTITANTLAMFDDGSLAPGDSAGKVGVLSVTGNATLSNVSTGGAWRFDVGNSTNTSGDRLAVSGTFGVTGTPALTVNVTPAYGHLDAGSRTIVSHTGGANASANAMVAQITDVAGNPLTTRQTVAVSGSTAGQINVVVTGEEAARTWNGNVTDGWDVSTSNWQGGDSQYRELDRVTFNDSATGSTNVGVGGSRFPGSVTFANNAKNYTLSGVGGIIGTGTVAVTGTGQVTFANTGNNYSGDTNIAGGGSLRTVSATTGAINNSGTLSLGITVNSQALVQNATQTIGASARRVLAVEAENYLTYTETTTPPPTGPPVFQVVSDGVASAGQALQASGTSNTTALALNQQNYVTYNVKFTQPGTYFWYGRIKADDLNGSGSTADEDSVWFANADLGNGATNPGTLSTRLDLGAPSSAFNAEGTSPNAAGGPGTISTYDWYLGRGNNSGGAGGGFDRILVSPNDVSAGTVFQFKMATREAGVSVDKFVFVQDPNFAGPPATPFGGITDADLDAVPVISTTSAETITTVGNILNVGGNFTMTSDASVLNMLLSTSAVHDQINVSGALAANGILNLTAPSGLGAVAGDVFDIFTFASVSGAFDAINLPSLSVGLGWDTSNLLVNGQLAVVQSAVPGDFNLDGRVDGSDFLLWQRNQAVGNLADWKANFGTGSAIPAAAVVPEPSEAVLVMTAIAALGGAQRRRRLQTTCA
jgi:autotransporter-associated beta strand protein